MTRSKKLIILMIAFVAIAALAFITTNMNFNSKDNAETYPVLENAALDDITGISWKFGEISYEFKNDGNKWINLQDGTKKANETYLKDLLEQVKNLSASKVIEENKTGVLSEFGLDEPECTIYITCGNENFVLEFGNENEMGGARYCSNGDGNVYLVDSEIISYFECSDEDIMLSEDGSVTSTDAISNTDSENK